MAFVINKPEPQFCPGVAVKQFFFYYLAAFGMQPSNSHAVLTTRFAPRTAPLTASATWSTTTGTTPCPSSRPKAPSSSRHPCPGPIDGQVRSVANTLESRNLKPKPQRGRRSSSAFIRTVVCALRQTLIVAADPRESSALRH